VQEKRRRRIWVQHVAVSVQTLQTRLDVAAARGLRPEQEAAAVGVKELLAKARDAAFRHDPIPSRLSNWWRGTLIDAAYQNLHAASAQIVDLYNRTELAGEAPSALSRARATIHRDDPRHIDAIKLAKLPIGYQRVLLRKTIEDTYDALDRQHERVRSFRNIIMLLALLVALFVGITIAVVATHPTVMPLCFEAAATGQVGAEGAGLVCPTGSNVSAPTGGDILIVALLGMLGGALAAVVSIRNLRGTSSPYDVPVALALLKIPLGAFTAILGLVAIRGDFIPGLSALDSQEQILAYALILGFAQQIFTRLLDRQAQVVLNALPAKEATPSAGAAPAGPPLPPLAPPPEEIEPSPEVTSVEEAPVTTADTEAEPDREPAAPVNQEEEPAELPPSESDEGEHVQDDRRG
jgi:hypothetical protein